MGADGPIEAVCSLFWTGGCGVRKFDLSRMNPVVLGGGGVFLFLTADLTLLQGCEVFIFLQNYFDFNSCIGLPCMPLCYHLPFSLSSHSHTISQRIGGKSAILVFLVSFCGVLAFSFITVFILTYIFLFSPRHIWYFLVLAS